MTLVEELQQTANDYVAGRVTLAELGRWLNNHLTEYADMKDDDPASGPFGFIQTRVWENDAGHLPEAELRDMIREFLSSEGLLTPAPERRAV